MAESKAVPFRLYPWTVTALDNVKRRIRVRLAGEPDPTADVLVHAMLTVSDRHFDELTAEIHRLKSQR